jgi:hypothetical protein
LRSTAQNKGCDCGLVGSGKLTKSTVTCPNIPFEYKASPMLRERVIIFILGKDYYGKIQPAFWNSLAENLSIDPIRSTLPSGSMRNETEGAPIYIVKHVGAASMTPPTLQKFWRYSYHPL